MLKTHDKLKLFVSFLIIGLLFLAVWFVSIWLNHGNKVNFPKGFLLYSDGNAIRKISFSNFIQTNKKNFYYLDDFPIALKGESSALGYIDFCRVKDLLCYIEHRSAKETPINVIKVETLKNVVKIDSPSNGLFFLYPSFSNRSCLLALLACSFSVAYKPGEYKLFITDPFHISFHEIASLKLAPVKPSWSPNDLYLSVTQSDSTILIISKDGTIRYPVGKGYGATWSPDGKRILCYANNRTVIAYNLGKDYHPTNTITVFKSRRPLDISFAPVVDTSGRYVFLHRKAPFITCLLAMNDVYDLVMIDTYLNTRVSLLRNNGTIWGFSYCLLEK